MPPTQLLVVAFAIVCFAVAAYLSGDVPHKLSNIGLVLLTLALLLT